MPVNRAGPASSKKSYGLHACHVECFSAADVLAGGLIVAPHHIGLRFGKAGTVSLIRTATQLGLLTPHQPAQLILIGFAAKWAGHHMSPLLRFFIEKVAFFHLSSFYTLGSIIPHFVLKEGGHHGEKAQAGVQRRQGSQSQCSYQSRPTEAGQDVRGQAGAPRTGKIQNDFA